MERLQGPSWHAAKDKVVIHSYVVSGNDNIAVFGKNSETNEDVFHWLNNEEKQTFNKENYQEKKWEEFFPENKS